MATKIPTRTYTMRMVYVITLTAVALLWAQAAIWGGSAASKLIPFGEEDKWVPQAMYGITALLVMGAAWDGVHPRLRTSAAYAVVISGLLRGGGLILLQYRGQSLAQSALGGQAWILLSLIAGGILTFGWVPRGPAINDG